LARAVGRKREIAIRAAMGARRWRIVRQLLAESLMLSLVAGLLGLFAGFAGIRVLLNMSLVTIPRIGPGGSNVSLDWRVFGFTLALSIVTAILFGLVPALQWSRTDLSTALKESNRRSGSGFRQQKTRALLVTMEVALAVVLLVGAALLIRTFIAIRQVHPGFDAQNVLTMRMSLTGPQFEKPADVTRVVHEALRRIRALPGVEAAAGTCCMPLEDRLGGTFRIAGRPEGTESLVVGGFTRVSPGYFETFRIPVRRGRTFVEADEGGQPVAIINDNIAKRFWPNGDPLNGELIVGNSANRIKIIGIVADVHDSALNRDPRPNAYLLSAHLTDTAIFKDIPWVWVIRTQGPPTALSSAIQNELREATGGLPAARVRTMEEVLSRSTAVQNFNALVLTIFGGSALFLAGIGIYGLMAYSVTQRAQEMGIRMALGAEPQRVRNMVVRQGLRLTLAGIMSGLVASFGLTRLISAFLFGVKQTDPLVFIVAPTVLLVFAFIAIWLPAVRASRVDPVRALRHE
jgi:predicted permease